MFNTKKILIGIIIILILVISLLCILLFILILDDAFEHKIPDYSIQLTTLVEKNKGQEILANELGSNQWDRVCFFGPYSDDVSSTLNFEFDISVHTDVLNSDGHNVLLFIKNEQVINLLIQNRSKSDLSDLSRRCLSRNDTLFIKPDGTFVLSE